MRKLHVLGVLAILALALNGCGKKAETPAPFPGPVSTAPTPTAGVNVSTVTLGNAIGPMKKVAQPADSFARNDTIYASVDTTGAGTAVLKAKWTYQADGKDVPVREDSQTVTSTGPATSEFHVSKPDGWPTGNYKVEVFVAGNSAGTKTFSVR